MQLKTKQEPAVKVKTNREKIADLRVRHQPLFDTIGVKDALFYPKMAYLNSKGEKIISFFPSEIGKGEDIYTEFVSRDYVSEDPDRTLYKWKFNPFYETEYETTQPHPVTGDIRYEVPINELIDIETQTVAVPWFTDEEIETEAINAILPDSDIDLPMAEMTMRDYAAIHLAKPISRKAWLNEIINSNK
jgi:hypothetical protein